MSSQFFTTSTFFLYDDAYSQSLPKSIRPTFLRYTILTSSSSTPRGPHPPLPPLFLFNFPPQSQCFLSNLLLFQPHLTRPHYAKLYIYFSLFPLPSFTPFSSLSEISLGLSYLWCLSATPLGFVILPWLVYFSFYAFVYFTGCYYLGFLHYRFLI